jgi:hypothetical protein
MDGGLRAAVWVSPPLYLAQNGRKWQGFEEAR